MNALSDSFRVRCAAAVVAVAAATIAPQVGATLITFDDLSDNGLGSPIVGTYAGFNWTNFDVLDVPLFVSPLGQPNGYGAALQSGRNIGFNAFGNAAGISAAAPFTLVDGYFAAGFWNPIEVTVTGYAGNVQKDQTVIVMGQSTATHAVFNWSGIDNVQFVVTGGTPPEPGEVGKQFGFDNLTLVSSVPEPSGQVLMAAGLLVLGVSASLRRRV